MKSEEGEGGERNQHSSFVIQKPDCIVDFVL